MTPTAVPAAAPSRLRPVFANLTAPALVAEALRRDEGRLSEDGALIVATGVHTGRSVQDKFVVDEPETTADVWWGKVNQRLAPEKFAILSGRVQAYLQGQDLFTQDLYAGADPARRVRVRAGHHGRLGGAVRAQHVHPSAGRRPSRLRAGLHHPARAAVPGRSGDRRRAAPPPPSRCPSRSARSSSRAPNMLARSRNRSSP